MTLTLLLKKNWEKKPQLTCNNSYCLVSWPEILRHICSLPHFCHISGQDTCAHYSYSSCVISSTWHCDTCRVKLLSVELSLACTFREALGRLPNRVSVDLRHLRKSKYPSHTKSYFTKLEKSGKNEVWSHHIEHLQSRDRKSPLIGIIHLIYM